MTKYIHNTSGSAKSYVGIEVPDNSFYPIQPAMLSEFQTSSTLISDLANSIVTMSANGTSDISGTPDKHVAFLLDNDLPPRDADNSEIFKPKTTRTGWHYEPRSIDFRTSKRASLYNREYDGNTIEAGTDIGDASIKFFDASGAELVQGGGESDGDYQLRLDTDCVRTQVDWQPDHDVDIIGGAFILENKPTSDAYAWLTIAPDLPVQFGGAVPHFQGGFNLSFFNAGQLIQFDGRGTKTVLYDPIYNTNTFRFLVKHAAGEKIGIQVIYDLFKG